MLLTKISRLIILFFLMASMTTCVSEPHQLKVGVNNWLGYAPLYLNDSSVNATEADYQIINFSSTTDTMLSIRNNTLEAAALTLDEAIVLAYEGVKLDIVLILDFSNGGDALISKTELVSIANLKGKNIAVEDSAVGAILLDGALASANLSFDDVNINHCAFDQHNQCFNNNDALITFEPVLSQLTSQGAHVLFDSTKIPYRIIDVLVVRRDIQPSNRQYIQILIDNYFKLQNKLEGDSHAFDQQLTKFTGLTADEIQQALSGITSIDRETNKNLLSNNEFMQEKIELLSHILVDNHHLLQNHYTPIHIDGRFVSE